jgi:SAM-dependent methyltransferase
MIIVSQLLNNYYQIRLSSLPYRKKVFKLALDNKLRQTKMGKVLLRNVNVFMAAHPELHSEILAMLDNKNYQEIFWASDLGYTWYESNFRTANVYFEFAKQEILKKHCESILDIGCGWGEFCASSSLIPGVKKVTGIDISDKIIEIARNKNKNAKVTYENKSIFEVSEKYDMITIFGAPDYINPPEFIDVIEKTLELFNKEIVIVNSMRKVPFEECLKLENAVEVKRYDTGYIQPLNYILEGLKQKHGVKFEITKYGIDSQMAVIYK